MFNVISALVLVGTLSTTAAGYLMNLEDHSKEVSAAYADSAIERFKTYDDMLPGVVEWPQVK